MNETKGFLYWWFRLNQILGQVFYKQIMNYFKSQVKDNALSCSPMVLNQTRGDFATQGTFDNVWKQFDYHNLERRVMLLASSGHFVMLLNILSCTGRSPQQIIIWPKMWMAQRWKNYTVIYFWGGNVWVRDFGKGLALKKCYILGKSI